MLTNEEIEYFTRSKIALLVLNKINERTYMAEVLSSEIKKHRESISRIFKRLTELGFAECLKPNSSNFRPYKITRKGKTKLKEIQEFFKRK